jgi:Raf kinase inhibitor-like YbhB/YbcL family protein
MDEIKGGFARLLLLMGLTLGVYGCETETPATATPSAVIPLPSDEPEASSLQFSMTSPAFSQGEPIPTQYTCDGEDISPPLAWQNPPEDTQSFALIADDPDAPSGTWVHWVLYNLPADARGVPQGVPTENELSGGGQHGSNSWNRLGYGGPCPPGGTHRYFFKLYAVDTILDLEPGVRKDALTQGLDGHVLAQTEIMGTYSRQ